MHAMALLENPVYLAFDVSVKDTAFWESAIRAISYIFFASASILNGLGNDSLDSVDSPNSRNTITECGGKIRRQIILMKTINTATLYTALAAMLLGPSAFATVTYVGTDWTTDANWRTSSVVKPNDADGDNIYGSEGYYLPSGLEADEDGTDLDPFLTVTNVITGNPYEINTLPSYILSLSYTNSLERGQSWGGARDEEGTLDLVPGDFTGETGAGILMQNDVATNTIYLTLKRASSPDFRLTLIFGNTAYNFAPGFIGDPLGFDSGDGWDVTLDDGSGAVGPEESGDASLEGSSTAFTTYQSWDISAGSSDILIAIATHQGTDVPRLSGLAIDALTSVAPSILAQPQGTINYVGSPVSLSVTAVGTALTYQWLQNSNPIPGATSWDLTLLNSVETNSGSYQVVVSNSLNAITSAAAVVEVLAIPTTVIFADSLSNNAGAFLNGRTPDTTDTTGATWIAESTWTMSGTGASAPSSAFVGNAWLPFSPVSGRIYTLSAVLDDAAGGSSWAALGFTSVLITNNYFESIDTYGWMLARDDGDSLDNEVFVGPGAGGAGGGETHLFSTGPATYSIILDATPTNETDWTFTYLVNGTVVHGATRLGSSPTLTGVGFGDLFDAATVSSFSLVQQTPPRAPFIVTPPPNERYFVGDTITLSASVGGSDPLTYKWQENSNDIPGATNLTLVITNASLANSGNYVLFVHNPLGDTNSIAGHVLVLSLASTNVYGDNFTGSGSLNGRMPDSAGAPNQWIAAPTWTVSGAQTAATAPYISAWLPFVPQPNRVYTLSATIGVAGNDGDWIALGFYDGSPALPGYVLSDPIVGWMLHRNIQTAYSDSYFIGPSTGGVSGSMGDLSTGSTNCIIVLDTQPALPEDWTVTYLEGSSVTNSTVLQPAIAFGFDPDIQYVGFGNNGQLGFVQNFSVTMYVPPPPLQIAISGSSITVSWLAATAVNYSLQSAANVLGPWQAVGTAPVNVGGTNQVTVSVGGTAQYFRLIQ
jgi:hypothetical protein